MNERDKLLFDTNARNNDGIELEKAGLIDKAIAVYEANIEAGYPATHPFKRLMTIYRKRKNYADEIRVILRAIEVYSKENERRLQNSLSKPENKKYKEQILSANESNTGFKNDGLYTTPIPLWNVLPD